MEFHLVARLSPGGLLPPDFLGTHPPKRNKGAVCLGSQRAFLLPGQPLPPLLTEEKRNENSALLGAVGKGEWRVSLLIQGIFDAPARIWALVHTVGT